MSIFSIGVSGLNTAQVALHTASNNISNVYTPGYNRELTLLSQQRPDGGVKVMNVQRQFDYFISSQLNRAISSASSLQSYQTQISQIDNLLADTETGLSPMMQNFFSALQDLTANPSDPAARQGVLGTAQTLTAQFRSMDNYLQDMQRGIGLQVESEVLQINNVAEQIAGLNHDISLARARSGTEAPNALLNERDQLVSELNAYIETSLSIQNGDYNITIGNGLPLVSGKQAYSLSAITSEEDPARKVLAYIDSAGNTQELNESTFSGGRLGGLLAFRADTLDKVQNHVGALAVTFAMAFNEVHESGMDINGDPGQAFFGVAPPQVFSSEQNTGSAVLSAEFDDYTGIQAGDYRIVVTDAVAGELQVSSLNGGQPVMVTLDASNQVAVGGMLLTVDDPLAMQNGDVFRVYPTRQAAAGFDVLLTGTGQIAAGITAETGDNRNALALQALQDAGIAGGGNFTASQFYAALVGDVGNRTNIVNVNLSAQEGLRDQIRTVQQSESGVNLDEEAANLIRYQQYYQANARVIDVASTLLDTLLGMR